VRSRLVRWLVQPPGDSLIIITDEAEALDYCHCHMMM